MYALEDIRVSLTRITCGECHIVFAIPTTMDDKLRDTHQKFWCPNGHHISYQGKSEKEQKIVQLEADLIFANNQKLAAQKRMLEEARKAQRAQHRARAFKAAATKIRNRVKHGVCPCCKRTFKQLASHMLMKHPEYVREGVK